MTDRLYYTNAYLTAFDAHLVATSDDRTRVALDATAFYPTSGGQPHDLGTLGGVPVVDVTDDGDRVMHVLASPLAATPGATLTGRVDWERRFDNMQQHTGQHLLSAVFEDLFGHKTISVHFGPDYATLDVDADSLSRDRLVTAERRANGLVLENRPVEVTFEDAAAATGLRKPSDRAGLIRIVSIDGVDRSACGGTHVRSTGEIGPVLVRSIEKIRKATRIEFLCGNRALARARRDYESLTAIAASLSASIDEAGTIVAAQAERLKDAEASRRRIEKELAGFRARELYDVAPVSASGARIVTIGGGAESAEELRALSLALIALPRCVVIARIVEPPSVILAAAEDSDVDAGRLLKEELAAAGGRGGGSARIAQGSVADVAALVVRLVNRLG